MARSHPANPRTLPRRFARAVVLCGVSIVCAVLLGAKNTAKAQTLFVLSSSNYTQNFDSMGTSSSAATPTGWFITTNSTNFTDTGGTNVTRAYGTVGTGAVAGNSAAGAVNWGNGTNASATDRALGFLNSGSYTTGKSLVFGFTNSTGSSVTNLSLAWDYEKYRSGSRAWTWTFAYSTNGTSWITNASGGQAYAADANNTTVNNPPTTIAKSFSIGSLSIGNGSSVYLRWTLDGDGGSSNGQGLAVDNFSMTAAYSPSLPPGNFWAGAAGGGGSGIWTSTSTNWATGAGGSGRGGTQATSGALVFTNTAGTVDVGGPVTVNAGMQFATDGYTVRSNTITLAGANAAANTITTDTGVGTTINSVLAGSNGMTKEGAGTLTLGGANTYSGGTLVSAGRLVGSTTSLQGAITNNAALTFDQSTNGTYSGVLSGSGSLLKTNAGTLTLSGNNSSFAGAVSIAAGAVRVSNAGALGNTTGSTTVSSGAALELTVSPGAEAISLAGSGISAGGALRNISGNNTLTGLLTLTAATRINSDSGTLTLDVSSGNAITGTHNLTVGGAGNVTIADNVNIATGTLTKDGVGVLTLSGANTYTGATTINDGRLNVTGSTAAGSAVTVNSGGTLGGGGTVGGAVTINSGGTVSPGTSPGTLTVGSMTWQGGGHYNWQLHNATGAAGTGWDLIDATGAFTLNNSSGNKFNINLWTLSGIGPDTNGSAINFSQTSNYSWLIAQSGSVITGFDAAAFNLNTSANNGTAGFANPFSGTFSLDLDDDEKGIVLSYAGAAPAATNTWTGGAGGGTAWRVVGNWSEGAFPATNAVAEFGATGTSTNIGINMNQASGLQQVGRVDLTGGINRTLTNSAATNGIFQINGVGGKLLVNSTSDRALTLADGASATMDLRFASAGEIEVVNSGARIIIGSTIIGTNGFTKTGAGTLQLTASNSFSGDVTVSGGTLSLESNGALASNANITINAGGTLRSGVTGLTNAINTNAALTIAGNGIINLAGGTERIGSIASGSSTASLVIGDSGASSGGLTVGDATSTTFEGVISGTRATGPILTKTGNGTLTLAGNNTYTGSTLISAGTLQVGAGGATGQLGAGNITNNATLAVNRSGSLTMTNIVSGSGNLVKSGSGTLVLSGANTYSGGTLVSAGTLQLGEGGSTGSVLGAITNNATVAVNRSGSFNMTNIVSGSGNLVKAGTGTVTLTGANTYSGATTIGGGTLRIDGNARLGNTGTTLTISNAGVLDVTAAGTLTNNITIGAGNGVLSNSSGGALVIAGGVVKDGTVFTSRSGSGTNVFTGVISGASANSDFIVDGGTTVFSNQMTYNGPTIITNGGTLVLGTNNATPATSGLVLGGGTLLIGDATTRYSTTFASLTLTADSTIDMGANGGLGTLTFGDSSLISWAGTLTITNWQGVAQTSSDLTRLVFGVDGLNNDQLGQIVFASQGITGGELIGVDGELAPIPEAPVVWGAAAVTAFIFWRERRRLLALFVRGRK